MALTGKVSRKAAQGIITHGRAVEGTPTNIPEITLTVNPVETSKKASLTFNDSNLSVAGMLIWQHNLNRSITSFRLKQLSTGTDFNIQWDEPNINTIRLDFGNEPRPIPGTWELLIFAA